MKVQLATRLDPHLRQRLRIYAALTERTVENVVSAALDGYLPAAVEMIREPGIAFSDPALDATERPGEPVTSVSEAALGAGTTETAGYERLLRRLVTGHEAL